MLSIEETPEYCQNSVYYGQAPIEWKLGNLCGWEFSISVSESNDRLIVVTGVPIGSYAIIACLLNGIIDRSWIIEVDCLCYDEIVRDFGGIGSQDELSKFCTVAEIVVHVLLVANILSLDNISTRSLR